MIIPKTQLIIRNKATLGLNKKLKYLTIFETRRSLKMIKTQF